jgi:hypothetical protein
MVAMVVFLCCRAAPIAASMAVLGPGSDRPAAVRPQSIAEDGGRRFFCPARNAAPLRQGKKAGLAVAGRRSRRSRPSGPDPSIRGCVGTDPSNRPMETNMTAVIVDAQRPGIADRIKTCARASTSKTAQPGERRRKIAERSAPRGAGSEDPGEHGSSLGVRNDGAHFDQLAGDRQRWRRRAQPDLVPP